MAYADARATFFLAHARWLANFPVHFGLACILLSRDGAPVRPGSTCRSLHGSQGQAAGCAFPLRVDSLIAGQQLHER